MLNLQEIKDKYAEEATMEFEKNESIVEKMDRDNKKLEMDVKKYQDIKKFENVIHETNNGYIKKTVIKTEEGLKEAEIPVAPFTIKLDELVRCEDYAEFNARIVYDGREYSTTLSERDFLTVKDFESAISKKISPALWFDGDKKDLIKIKKLLLNKKVKVIKGVKCSGMHKHNNEWVYVTLKGALKPNGSISEDVKLLAGHEEIDNSSILKESTINDIETLTLLKNLFHFNAKTISASFMGYISALFLKERLWEEFDLKFPNMAIIGQSGAGKSETMEKIGLKILNMETNNQFAANQFTKFTGLKNSNSSNTAPFIVNEYKPHKMPQWIINDIDNLINSSYDRYKAKRGNQDQSTTEYNYNAPCIIVGESYTADQSAVERLIRIYLTKDESLQKFEHFKELAKESNLLNKLGKTLLLNALNVSKEELKEWMLFNKNLVDTKNIETTRGKGNIAIVLLGIDLLNKSLNDKLKEKLLTIKNHAITRYVLDTLEGNSNSKTAIGEILEKINQLAVEGTIKEDTHFKLMINDSALALDIKTIFGKLLEVCSTRREALPLSQAEFTKMIIKEPFFKDYKLVKLYNLKLDLDDERKLAKENRRCYILDSNKLSEHKLEISALTGIEIDEVFSEAQ